MGPYGTVAWLTCVGLLREVPREITSKGLATRLVLHPEPDGETMRCWQSESGKARWEVPIAWAELQSQFPDYVASVEEAARQAGLSLR
jgi:hypothetical protein